MKELQEGGNEGSPPQPKKKIKINVIVYHVYFDRDLTKPVSEFTNGKF